MMIGSKSGISANRISVVQCVWLVVVCWLFACCHGRCAEPDCNRDWKKREIPSYGKFLKVFDHFFYEKRAPPCPLPWCSMLASACVASYCALPGWVDGFISPVSALTTLYCSMCCSTAVRRTSRSDPHHWQATIHHLAPCKGRSNTREQSIHCKQLHQQLF